MVRLGGGPWSSRGCAGGVQVACGLALRSAVRHGRLSELLTAHGMGDLRSVCIDAFKAFV